MIGLPPCSGVMMIRQAAQTAREASAADRWTIKLGSLRGVIGTDGVEWISTSAVFEALEVPLERRPELTRRLSSVMRDLGWQATRIRAINHYESKDSDIVIYLNRALDRISTWSRAHLQQNANWVGQGAAIFWLF